MGVLIVDVTSLRERKLEAIRRISRLLDSQFRLPGTTVRFGLDPIIGLVPALGDFVTPAFSLLVIYRAFRNGVPRVVQLRMLLNVVIDLVVGAVPVAGDLFDFAWRSNAVNLALLERHAHPDGKPTSGDWAVVLLVFIVVVGVALLVVLSVAWMAQSILQPIFPAG